MRLRIEVVKDRDEDRLRRAGQLRGSVLRLAVMADDDVLQDTQRIGRQPMAGLLGGDRRLDLQPDRPPHNVADQIAVGGVIEALLPLQLSGLAQVVQEQSHQHDVAVERRIQRQHDVGELEQLQRVLKQPTDESVMQADRGGSSAEAGHQLLIRHIPIRQRFHRRVFEGAEDSADFLEHLVDVAPCRRQQRRQLILADLDRFDLLDDELDLAVVQLRVPGRPDEAGGAQLADRLLIEAPLPAHNLAGGVPQQALEVRLARSGGTHLRVDDAVHTLDVAGRRQRADVGMWPSGRRHRNRHQCSESSDPRRAAAD